MKPEQIETIITNIQFTFGNKLDEDQVVFWADFLQRQSFPVCKKVLDWYKFESGVTFIPAISEFAGKIKAEQISMSIIEAGRIDSSKCRECEGLTWGGMSDPSGCIPCSACRPSAFAKWSEGAYEVSVPPDQDELEGPKQSYQMAAKDNHYTGTPVDPARALQWVNHIRAMTPDSPVYPEGDFDPALAETINNSTRKEIDLEF